MTAFFRDSIFCFFSRFDRIFSPNGLLFFFLHVFEKYRQAFYKIPSSDMLFRVRIDAFERDPNGILGLTVFLMVLTVFLMVLTVCSEIPSLDKMSNDLIQNCNFHEQNTVMLNLFLINPRRCARFDSILEIPSRDSKCRLLKNKYCH